MEEEKTNSKMNSRKFIVWVVWLFIAIIVMAFCTVVMIVTKQILDSMVSLIEKSLTYFFAISSIYLGVNFGQKVGIAVAEALGVKNTSDTTETTTENTEETTK